MNRSAATLPVLTALREWSDQWVFGAGNEPILMVDRHTGRTVAPLRVRDTDGNEMSRRDLRAVAGPGADERTKRLLHGP